MAAFCDRSVSLVSNDEDACGGFDDVVGDGLKLVDESGDLGGLPDDTTDLRGGAPSISAAGRWAHKPINFVRVDLIRRDSGMSRCCGIKVEQRLSAFNQPGDRDAVRDGSRWVRTYVAGRIRCM